jgi:hypothetical protein
LKIPQLIVPAAPWARPGGGRRIDQQSRSAQEKGSGAVVQLGELVMILDLHRQGLTISAIAREVGVDRKTVRDALPVAWTRRSMALASRASDERTFGCLWVA